MRRYWLEKILKKKKLTHQAVAEMVEVDRSYFTQIVGGVRRPSPELAQRIGNVLGFDWTVFFNKLCGEKPQNIPRDPNPAA